MKISKQLPAQRPGRSRSLCGFGAGISAAGSLSLTLDALGELLTKMTRHVTRILKPEEEELVRKRAELDAILATLTERELELADLRSQLAAAALSNEWVFPAETESGHIEKSTVKKQHQRACSTAKLPPLPLYTFRHTCLTRWAAYMDPYTLAYLAGHSDFSTTKRYVHPQAHTVRDAMERARAARGGHSSGHTSEVGQEMSNSQIAVYQ